MGIGQRIPVKIQPYTATQNAAGAWVESEGNKIEAWAEITNPSEFRVYQSGQTQLGQTKDFTIRYRFDKFPNANWRVIYDGRIWTVSEVRKMDEKKFYYRLTATSKE